MAWDEPVSSITTIPGCKVKPIVRSESGAPIWKFCSTCPSCNGVPGRTASAKTGPVITDVANRLNMVIVNCGCVIFIPSSPLSRMFARDTLKSKLTKSKQQTQCQQRNSKSCGAAFYHERRGVKVTVIGKPTRNSLRSYRHFNNFVVGGVCQPAEPRVSLGCKRQFNRHGFHQLI